jgi:hypothetical protein
MFEDDDWKNTVFIKAIYKPHEEQKKAEAPVYFMPNSIPSKINNNKKILQVNLIIYYLSSNKLKTNK